MQNMKQQLETILEQWTGSLLGKEYSKAIYHLPSQKKLIELQAGKKSLEDQVEVLRTLKEEAEKPEEAAKDQHRRLWEGTLLRPAWLGCPLGSCQGRVWAQESLAHCLLSVVPLVFLNHGPLVPQLPHYL